MSMKDRAEGVTGQAKDLSEDIRVMEGGNEGRGLL